MEREYPLERYRNFGIWRTLMPAKPLRQSVFFITPAVAQAWRGA